MSNQTGTAPTVGSSALLAVDAALLKELRSDMLDFMEERKAWWKSSREGKGEWYARMQDKVCQINGVLINAGHQIG